MCRARDTDSLEGGELCRDGGKYLEMGNAMPGHTTPLDPALLTRNAIDVTSAIHYPPRYLREALAFLADNADDYPYGDLIDAEFGLHDVETALSKSDRREVTRATLSPTR